MGVRSGRPEGSQIIENKANRRIFRFVNGLRWHDYRSSQTSICGSSPWLAAVGMLVSYFQRAIILYKTALFCENKFMTIDERLEALTHSVELLAQMQIKTEREIQRLGKYVRTIVLDHKRGCSLSKTTPRTMSGD